MVKNLRPKQSNEEELINLFGLTRFLQKKLGNLIWWNKAKGKYCFDFYV